MFSIFKKSKPKDYDALFKEFTTLLTKYKWDDIEQVKRLIQPAISLYYASGKAATGQSKFIRTPSNKITFKLVKQ